MYHVDLYIETSIKGPGTREGWCASVLEYQTKRHGVQTREDFQHQEKTTYSQLGLIGIAKSLKRLNASCSVTIHTDNSFIMNMVERKIPEGWKKNGWKNSRGEEVANKVEWQEFVRLTSGHKVTFEHKDSHKYSEWMKTEAKARFEK